MIYKRIKRKSNQIFFKKQLSFFLEKSAENLNKGTKKILVILDNVSEKLVIEKKLSKLLNVSKGDIETVIFLKKNNKNNEEDSVVTKRDFGWFGKLKSVFLKNILTKKYDLLINYSKVDNLYSNLLLLQCKTDFRVGFAHLDNRLYDLLIDSDPEDLDLFNSELLKYLKILNRIE